MVTSDLPPGCWWASGGNIKALAPWMVVIVRALTADTLKDGINSNLILIIFMNMQYFELWRKKHIVS